MKGTSVSTGTASRQTRELNENPGRSRCLAREVHTQLTSVSRALAPAAAAEAVAAGPGRPRSPGSPNRPGTSASQAAAERRRRWRRRRWRRGRFGCTEVEDQARQQAVRTELLLEIG